LIRSTIDWIKRDFHDHPWRMIGECYNWFASIACSIILAITVNDPALYLLYPLWLSGCSIAALCAWSRGSFGQTSMYVMLTCIDIYGFTKYILT
jgi:hypothetical protein